MCFQLARHAASPSVGVQSACCAQTRESFFSAVFGDDAISASHCMGLAKVLPTVVRRARGPKKCGVIIPVIPVTAVADSNRFRAGYNGPRNSKVQRLFGGSRLVVSGRLFLTVKNRRPEYCRTHTSVFCDRCQTKITV